MGITAAGQPDSLGALATEVERLRRLVMDAGKAATEAKAATALVGGQVSDVRGEVAALGTLRTQVRVLADRVTDLVTRPANGAELAAVVSWFDAALGQAEQLLDDLAQWLAEVGVHHRQIRLALSGCWFRHPAAVEALNALRLVWFVAYQGSQASASMAVDWHVRLMPGIAGLVESELRGCSEANHGPDGSCADIHDSGAALPSVGDPRLGEYARWWTSLRTRGEQTAPPMQTDFG